MRLDAHWGMLPAEGFKHSGDRKIKPQGGGGGGQPTSNTTQTSNIPEYAQPYVETMLGATQAQLFNTTPGAEGQPDQITGFKEYTP